MALANTTSRDWFPRSLPDQLIMFQNVKVKIGGYSAVLPLTLAQTTAITLICNEFIAVYNYVAQARATTESLVEWRDIIFRGSPTGGAAPAPPVYPSYSAVAGSTIGIFTAFRDFVDLIKSSPGYTQAIGEDLMIVATKPEDIAEGSVTPDLKVSTLPGYKVEISGSLQGMDALRVEYIQNGKTEWNIAAFLTKMPGEFVIAGVSPGQAVTGRIRAVFIKKNNEFGNFSPEYPVTLS